MFAIGIVENLAGFNMTFMAGVMSILGINYCDHNKFMIIFSHCTHAIWGTYTCCAMILALNRCVEMYSKTLADIMWGGWRIFLWAIPVAIWGLVYFSSWDVPPVYNSYYNTWMYQIDMRPGAPQVNDWICFWNSCFIWSPGLGIPLVHESAP
ncbi:serpentine type 7TM GPCR chemoreceptor srt domain-containing protein [Ditylenchus destructor]|nr:serpentine type 7TM GPCR chemoreceptor srt domain-containing protein [Ditylenchus destructor]